MVFLIVFAGLLYFTKKKVWREVERIRRSSSRAADGISAGVAITLHSTKSSCPALVPGIHVVRT